MITKHNFHHSLNYSDYMTIPINPEETEGKVVELSQDELDTISGGVVNVSFTLLMAEEGNTFIAESLAGGNSGLATSGQRRRSLFGIQISGTFESMDHFESFFSRLSTFFGRR